MRLAVTGSSGFVGSVLVPQLIAQGHHLKLLTRRKEHSLRDNTEFIDGNLSNRESLTALVKDIDIVIHLAAVISIKDGNDEVAYNTNVSGTKLLLEAARNAGAKRFIHLSSVTAFNQYPYDETLDETRALNKSILKNYDLSKSISQAIALSFNDKDFEVIALAPTAIFGPYDSKPSLIGNTIIKIYNRKIPALLKGGVDFVDVRDLVNAVINALTKGSAGQVYLISGEWIGLQQLISKVSDVKGKKVSLPFLPTRLIFFAMPFIKIWSELTGQLSYFTKQSVYNLIYSNKKISHALAEKELDFHARPFDESLKDTINWFKENNFIH